MFAVQKTSVQEESRNMQQDLTDFAKDDDSPVDVYARSVKGGAWLIALRVFSQLLNIVRITILMRLLAPHDFGLLGIGTLILAMVASFTDLGLRVAIIQRKESTSEHLNVVWTAGIIRGVLVFCVLYFLAPSVAIFFDGTGRFSRSHIPGAEKLVVRLRQGDDPVSAYLFGGFSAASRQLIVEFDKSGPVSEQLRQALIDEFNKVVEGPCIYDQERFADVDLSGYALKLAQCPAKMRDTARCNRRLLDEVYAGLIKRNVLDRTTAILVIQVLAFSVILGSLANIGVVYFTKDLEFHKRVLLQMIVQLVSTIVTVLLALLYKSVWALVFGKLAGAACSCALSYIMHPYRPRLSFDPTKAKELWEFGRHILAISILKFFCVHGDDAFLGKMLGATALGFYQQAFRIGNMVATEIGNKVADVGFPAYSKLQDNVDKLRSGYFKAVQTTSLIVFPIAGGLIVLAPEITEIVFGPKWLPMVPAMQILCLLGPLKCMQRSPVFMAMGRPDILTKITIMRFLVMLVSIYPLTALWDITGTSLCVLASGVVLQPVGFYELQKLIGARMRDVMKILFCPFLATLVMATCVYLAKIAIPYIGALSLVLLTGLGAALYFILILLLSKTGSDYDALGLVRDIAKGLKS